MRAEVNTSGRGGEEPRRNTGKSAKAQTGRPVWQASGRASEVASPTGFEPVLPA